MNSRQLLLPLLILALPCCRSTDSKKETEETRELSRLSAPQPETEIGGYYRLKKNVTGFYTNVPTFTQLLPDEYLMRGHIVQLLDPTVSGGWARVKNEKLQIGFVKFDSIKIVPWDRQPNPKKRPYDEELNRRMGSR